MKKAYKWIHPIDYDGGYPDKGWAGYAFLDWSKLGYWHEGVDYNKGAGDSDFGNPIFMPANGKMLWLGRHWPGYGSHCYTRHLLPDNNVVICHFAHLKEWSIRFGEGEEIEMGTQIAQVGNTGWNDMYSHLHFEIFRDSLWLEEVEQALQEGWAFWPDGWNKDDIKEFYHDPYYFIEARKDLEEPSECDDIKEKLEIVSKERTHYKNEWERLKNQRFTRTEAFIIFLESLFGKKGSDSS